MNLISIQQDHVSAKLLPRHHKHLTSCLEKCIHPIHQRKLQKFSKMTNSNIQLVKFCGYT